MKFVQIAAAGQSVFALDEQGRLWENRSGTWILLGDAEDAMNARNKALA